MSLPDTAPLGRRRFLTVSAGAALAATALPGCAASVDDSGSGGGSETLTIMSVESEMDKKTIKAAEAALGCKVKFVLYDTTKLNAMLASKTPPDVVRGLGATDTPYFAARG
ncbi:hypothetical protein SAZ11_04670 [Streptomyces sp. FXJ1.4098]|nr:hypothetical protein [Streptomyces sp. FXJ1.4098]